MGSTRDMCRAMKAKLLAAGLAMLALGGCVRGCPSGLARMDGVQMFFGGSLSDADWAEFAAATLTPAFPDGFTTYAASGQWRDTATGALVRERTRVVQVFGAGTLPRAESVAAVYRARFRQRSVGIAVAEACAGF